MGNYIVSARKYRPSTFKSVVGQHSLTVTLKNAITTNKLAHAYLFCGPRGVGKTSCARIFAKTINCLNLTAEGEACNECESCQSFNEQRSYNIHELDAASNNSVEDIRSLIEQVRIPPVIGAYKVFIIDEVHMLSSAAFNAFLKTLEEPPRHAIFILATTEKYKVLPTILSRCQIYDFSRISIADIVDHLEYVANSEGVTTERDALNVIAQKADGGMRDALSIFDQVVSFTNGNISYQAVIDNLNILDYQYYFKITESILAANVGTSLLLLNEILSKGFDGINIVTGLASHFRNLLVCKDEATLVLFEVGDSIRERYREVAKKCTETFLFTAINEINDCSLNYRESRNKRLLIEVSLIRLCQFCSTTNDSAKKKTKSLEPLQSNKQESSEPKKIIKAEPKKQEEKTEVVVSSSLSSSIEDNSKGHIVLPEDAPNKKKKPTHKISSKMPLSVTELAQKEKDSFEGGLKDGESEEELLNNSFSEEELQKQWIAFADQLKKRPYIKNGMLNNTPTLIDETLFEVVVYNEAQKEEFEKIAGELLPFLHKKLQNSYIKMSVRVTEKGEKKMIVTSAEKYQHFLEVNPNIQKLRETFNLRFD